MELLTYQLQFILQSLGGALLIVVFYWYILLIIIIAYVVALVIKNDTFKAVVAFGIPCIVFFIALMGFIFFFVRPPQGGEESAWTFGILLGVVTIGFALTIISADILRKLTMKKLFFILGLFIVLNFILGSITYKPVPAFSRPYCGAKECNY